MTRQAQAATLQLDPVRDQDEYNAFISFLAQIGGQDIGVMLEGLRSGTPRPAVARPADGEPRAARVAGVGPRPPLRSGRRHGDEGRHRDGPRRLRGSGRAGRRVPRGRRRAVGPARPARADAVRHRRGPQPLRHRAGHPGGAQRLLDRLIQIAAEGRKYGLWLLLSLQRPSKIHPQILSQCDNLMLMRMNSPDDVAELGRRSDSPPGRCCGPPPGSSRGRPCWPASASVPMLVQVRERLTPQGGSDVAVPIARPRPAS